MKLSSFIIEKTLSSLIKPKSVKKLINNTLLVEIPKKTSDLLLQQKYIYNLKIKANSLNLSKDVVRSPDLFLCTLDKIKQTSSNWVLLMPKGYPFRKMTKQF